jgi:hypothetical protein
MEKGPVPEIKRLLRVDSSAEREREEVFVAVSITLGFGKRARHEEKKR